MKEVFKPVEGYEGKYLISNKGTLRLVMNGVEGAMPVMLNATGYPRIPLRLKGTKTKWHFIHRLVATAFVANPDSKPFVNHKNGNKQDNRASNLEWCTNLENMQHSWRKGLRKGRLSRNSVLKIRETKDQYSLIELAIKYKVGKAAIRRVIEFKTYPFILPRITKKLATA